MIVYSFVIITVLLRKILQDGKFDESIETSLHSYENLHGKDGDNRGGDGRF